MFNMYVEDLIKGTWKELHKNIIEEFLIYLNKNSNDYVLKGGTALMECYGLERFSEDIDLDSRNNSTIFDIVEKFTVEKKYNFRVAKKTSTVSRFMLHYGGYNELGDKPLKIEISHRCERNPENVTKINGILVYDINEIASMKAFAYGTRDKLRDLFDLTYIFNHKKNLLNKYTISNIFKAISRKGLEQFDYITKTQHDALIDNDKLAIEFLTMYENLDIQDSDNQDLINYQEHTSPSVF